MYSQLSADQKQKLEQLPHPFFGVSAPLLHLARCLCLPRTDTNKAEICVLRRRRALSEKCDVPIDDKTASIAREERRSANANEQPPGAQDMLSVALRSILKVVACDRTECRVGGSYKI